MTGRAPAPAQVLPRVPHRPRAGVLPHLGDPGGLRDGAAGALPALRPHPPPRAGVPRHLGHRQVLPAAQHPARKSAGSVMARRSARHPGALWHCCGCCQHLSPGQFIVLRIVSRHYSHVSSRLGAGMHSFALSHSRRAAAAAAVAAAAPPSHASGTGKEMEGGRVQAVPALRDVAAAAADVRGAGGGRGLQVLRGGSRHSPLQLPRQLQEVLPPPPPAGSAGPASALSQNRQTARSPVRSQGPFNLTNTAGQLFSRAGSAQSFCSATVREWRLQLLIDRGLFSANGPRRCCSFSRNA